jgi:hypothetical protein
MVFNATFNNISVISWQSVLLVEETRVQHYRTIVVNNIKHYRTIVVNNIKHYRTIVGAVVLVVYGSWI